MKVVYYLPGTVNPFWREVVSGMESREGIALEIVSSDNDAGAQLAQLQDFQRKSPDAVFVTPVDMKGVSAACKAILNSGVPIIAIDQNLKPHVTASVISGNMKGGIMAAAYLAERLEAGSRIVQIRAEQHLPNVVLRGESFADEIGRRGLLIVEQLLAESNRSTALAKTAKLLESHIQFDAIFAENDNMALGAVAALKEARRMPRPLVVGFDGINQALEAIRNGSMDATIAQSPATLGQTAVDVLLLAVKGSTFQPVTTVMPRLTTKSDLISFNPDGVKAGNKASLTQ
ncbi:MAG TPA: sugar ABC transporter substrate-binding protein [Blastocatellia bacterium]|nr:sugar ABC transporter substrate-binding protein [Blastocatellia bacterium]